MKRAKILYLITGVNVGGAERLLFDMVKNLNGSQFEPVVVSLVGGVLDLEFQECGVRTYDVHMSRRWPIPGVWRLCRIILKEKPHIIHTHLIHADFFGRIAGWLCRVPIIMTTLHMVEDARRRFPMNILDRLAARCNTALIAVSDIVKKELIELEKLDAKKITVIQSGVTNFEFVSPEKIKYLHASLPIQPDTILIGIVSRLEVPRKGHHILFKALERLVHQFHNIHCVVIGDGLGREGLEQQVKQYQLNSHVTFLGTQHNIPEWLKALDIFVLPSLLEGFPVAIIEAMSAGCPIIATRVGGVGELIENNQNGLLIEPNNIPVLEEAIAYMIQNPEFRLRMGKAARQTFQERFDIQRAVEMTERLYHQCLERLRFSNRIRLLEVVTNLDPGGVPRHVEDLIQNLPSDIFEIEVVSGEKNIQRIERLSMVHHYVDMIKPIRPLRDIRSTWRLFRLFQKLRPDIVHSHMSKANCLASLAAKLARVPCVISTVHGRTLLTRKISAKQIMFDMVEWMTFRFFNDGTISVSHNTTRHLLKWRKVHPALNVTIHNGVHSASLNFLSRKEACRRLGLKESQLIILMIGRLAQPKSPEILIQACAVLREQFPHLVCLLAGDGPRRPELERTIDNHQLSNMVHLLGHRDDIQELLCAADIFVLSSWREGLPISILEAMATGLPIVASDVPGMEEVVAEGQTGYLMTKGSIESCAEALKLLLRDPEKRRAMGEAGFQKFQQEFNLSLQLAKTKELLTACSQKGFPKNFVFSKDINLANKPLESMIALERI